MTFSCINFECTFCGRHTDIYFENQFDASEVREPAICNKCGTESYCNVGDLGYRSDLSDPDYPPWQAQVIRLDPSKICCDQCLTEKRETLSPINLIALCENCKQESMVSGRIEKVKNQLLSKLLNLLSKSDK
jgi:hypothetical protein